MTDKYIEFVFNNTQTQRMAITAPGSASMYWDV